MSEPCKGWAQISEYNPCPQSQDATWSDINGLPGRQLTKTRGTFISVRQNCTRWDLWVGRFVCLRNSWVHDWLRRQQTNALLISCARGQSLVMACHKLCPDPDWMLHCTGIWKAPRTSGWKQPQFQFRLETEGTAQKSQLKCIAEEAVSMVRVQESWVLAHNNHIILGCMLHIESSNIDW